MVVHLFAGLRSGFLLGLNPFALGVPNPREEMTARRTKPNQRMVGSFLHQTALQFFYVGEAHLIGVSVGCRRFLRTIFLVPGAV